MLPGMDAILKQAVTTLPHGPEFRFLDRLLSLVPGKDGRGEYLVRGDEPFLRGHFPGNPLMPGVLLIEAAAQLAGTVAQTDPQAGPIPALKLAAIRSAKILGSARPGQKLQLEAHVTGRLGHLVQAQATVSVSDQLICQAELTLGGEAKTGP